MSDVPRLCYTVKNSVPAGDWWCTCPIINERVEGGDFWDMVNNCKKKLEDRGIMLPVDIVLQIEDALCSRLHGNEHCKPCTMAEQKIGFKEVVQWVRAMYSFAIKGGLALVPQEEAERRARICAACPHQIETSGCWGCRGVAGLIPAIAGARVTESDGQLKACGICGCYNAVSVHIPNDVQDTHSLQFPSFCWKNPQQSQNE
jgi:hypothetical protein